MNVMRVFLIAAMFVLVACSSDDSSKDDHVFKSQENALNKAKELQSTMDEQAEKTRKQLQQQSQ